MAKVEIDEQSGNAILVCRCGSRTDKGGPPVPGQDDSSFVCEACQAKADAKKVEAQVAAAGGSVTLASAEPSTKKKR